MNILKWLGLVVSLIGAGTLVYPILIKISREQLGGFGGVTALSILWAIALFGLSGRKK